KKPVKNVDLWKRLDLAASRHNVRWNWVKGHAGHRENEICDRLAKIAAYAAADTPHKKDAGFFWYKMISKYLPIILYHVSYPSSG
ncbi:TPA: hypothetical protein RRU09_005163, partial [Klebsiella pneumoniae]|nr:hypothetical protein [Klebsiella pneumoniae]